MEINGPERKSLAQNMAPEDFLIHVATDIERQLKEWDNDYEVMIMKLENYEFIIKHFESYFELSFSENILKALQKKDPYELDRKIWRELQNKGISIVKGKGSYIDFIMW